jgi:glucan biosynthesis protein C
MTKRFYAFDAARGYMMLLGIFAHTILLVNLIGAPLPNERIASEWVYQAIHLFRMPTFFLLAGFFGAMLMHRASFKGFIVSRFKRLVAPMLAALAVVAAFLVPLGCTACQSLGASNAAPSFLGYGLLHLWFIYDLVIISHIGLLIWWLGSKLPKAVRNGLSKLTRFYRLGVPSVLIFAFVSSQIPNVQDAQNSVRISMSFVPDWSLIGFFALFYAAGWIAFQNRKVFMASAKTRTVLNLALGLAFIILRAAGETGTLREYGWVFACVSMWFLAIGIVGLSQWIFAEENKTVSYIADASYWIYLVHPIFVLFSVFALHWLEVPAILNVILSVAIAFMISLGSYTWLVHETVLGKWLSGRRRGRIAKSQKPPIELG